jgi:hypothetical protein
MHKVIFWTKDYVVIEDSKVPALEQAMNGKKAFWLNHVGGRDLISPGSISRVTKATTLDYHPEPKPLSALGAGGQSPQLSESEKHANRDKLAGMKHNLLGEPKEANRDEQN